MTIYYTQTEDTALPHDDEVVETHIKGAHDALLSGSVQS